MTTTVFACDIVKSARGLAISNYCIVVELQKIL